MYDTRSAKDTLAIIDDKSVKCGGTVYPKNGWAVFMAGGPASGKSTVIKEQLMLSGTTLDPDNVDTKYLKTIEKALTDPKLLTDNIVDEEEKELALEMLDDLKQSDPTDLAKAIQIVHNYERSPFKRKLNSFIADYSKVYLENIIIDTTGRNIDKLVEQANLLKSLGYKLCLVWVITNINEAIKHNKDRSRTVDINYLVKTHKQILEMIPKILSDGTLAMFDDAWIVFTKDFSGLTTQFSEKYANTAKQLKKDGNHFVIPQKQYRKIVETVDKEHINTDTDSKEAITDAKLIERSFPDQIVSPMDSPSSDTGMITPQPFISVMNEKQVSSD